MSPENDVRLKFKLTFEVPTILQKQKSDRILFTSLRIPHMSLQMLKMGSNEITVVGTVCHSSADP